MSEHQVPTGMLVTDHYVDPDMAMAVWESINNSLQAGKPFRLPKGWRYIETDSNGVPVAEAGPLDQLSQQLAGARKRALRWMLSAIALGVLAIGESVIIAFVSAS